MRTFQLLKTIVALAGLAAPHSASALPDLIQLPPKTLALCESIWAQAPKLPRLFVARDAWPETSQMDLSAKEFGPSLYKVKANGVGLAVQGCNAALSGICKDWTRVQVNVGKTVPIYTPSGFAGYGAGVLNQFRAVEQGIDLSEDKRFIACFSGGNVQEIVDKTWLYTRRIDVYTPKIVGYAHRRLTLTNLMTGVSRGAGITCRDSARGFCTGKGDDSKYFDTLPLLALGPVIPSKIIINHRVDDPSYRDAYQQKVRINFVVWFIDKNGSPIRNQSKILSAEQPDLSRFDVPAGTAKVRFEVYPFSPYSTFTTNLTWKPYVYVEYD